MRGKKVFEILPAIDWNKGKAIRWIMQALGIQWSDASVVYIGDDTTDEDAFRVVCSRGTAILVSDKLKVSAADFLLSSPQEVRKLFEKVIAFS
jgi:trehalose-phosphatase